MAKNDLQGTLELLILKTLAHSSSLHGYGIVLHIERVSGDLLRVEEGSLYPALHRMEQNQWVRSAVGPHRNQSSRQVLLPHRRRP